MKKKVLVAMSGGVDSSVAALLLQKKGYEVVGLTMCLGVEAKDSRRPVCCGTEAIADARQVCEKLQIPHYVLDFSKDLDKYVIKPFVDEYRRGRTPNPCVNCNTHIKFKLLYQKARALGFDYLATGHYVALVRKNGTPVLKKARDLTKDQSYFLYGIDRKILPKLIFPLERLTKQQVRELARKNHLPISEKAESQDICFIPDGDRTVLISDRIKKIKPGNIVDSRGKIMGKHRGLPFYTVGQRSGLGISWRQPLYVTAISASKNEIVVGEKISLYKNNLTASGLNWFVKKMPRRALAKIRYSAPPAECRIVEKSGAGANIKVIFDEPQPAITPGQSIVFYDKSGLVLGGGIIEEAMSDGHN